MRDARSQRARAETTRAKPQVGGDGDDDRWVVAIEGWLRFMIVNGRLGMDGDDNDHDDVCNARLPCRAVLHDKSRVRPAVPRRALENTGPYHRKGQGLPRASWWGGIRFFALSL